MIVEDAELRQAISVAESYRQRVESLSRQVQVLRVSLDEVTMASEALKAFKDAKEGDEIMVPVGASSFVTAKVTSSPKAVVGIGNKVSVEKSLDDAVEYMKSNLAEITDALKKLNESMQEMDAAARNLSLAVQQEYQRRQQ